MISPRPTVRIFSEKNMSLFKSQLQHTYWTCIYDCDDVNYSYDILLGIISEAFEHCFPLTKLSRKHTKDKPWVTSALKKSSRVKNSLYKKWLKTKSKISEDRYKKIQESLQDYNKTVREDELSYYKELFDCRKLWVNLNKVCSFKKCNTSKSIRKLVINNKEVTEPHDISNGLNDFLQILVITW